MTRTATVQIDRDALQHNVGRVRELAPDSRLMAVIKADGYGHGALRIARLLDEHVDGFAVARFEEAMELRDDGIDKPLLSLMGPLEYLDVELAAERDCQLVVHADYQLELLEQARLSRPVQVWLKIDTGMHRLGFTIDRVQSAWQRLAKSPSVAEPIRLMTHLACADNPGDPATMDQLRLFEAATRHLPGEKSIANSAGILGWPDCHADWVRPGIMLYGGSPFVGRTGIQEDLQPVMQFDSRLVAVVQRRKGERIGYGGSGICAADMPVGVAAVGYGDGYPRHARQGTPVLVNGHRAALLGRVSMDMVSIDLRGVPGAAVGDNVRLWGQGLPVDEVADWADTIAYELFCGVTRRARFVDF